jgi:hypothetical protein
MSSVSTFVIVGQQDHPLYEADLVGIKEVGRAVLHAGTGASPLPAAHGAPWAGCSNKLSTCISSCSMRRSMR